MTALMRVIAGTYRSRILKSLKGLALRPTSDRLRETLFNVLAPNIAGSQTRFAASPCSRLEKTQVRPHSTTFSWIHPTLLPQTTPAC